MCEFSRSLRLMCTFFMSCLVAGYATDNVIDPNWLKPGALDRWEQRQRNLQQTEQTVKCDCPPPPEPPPALVINSSITEDQELSPVFYRKLVKTLFERDALQRDPSEAFFISALSLKVTSRQLDKLLDEMISIRDLDTTLAEILEQSNNLRRKYVLQENRCESLYIFLLEFVESKLLLNVIPIVMLLAACFVVRIIARLTGMHPFIVFLLLILSITVLNKWKECNEKLAKKMLNSGSAEAPVCDPLEVFVEATVSMQAVYFNAMFKQFINAFKEHTENLGFFERILIGSLLLGFAYILLTTFLQVGIASGFRMVGTVVSTAIQQPRKAALTHNGEPANAPQPTVNLNITIGDPIAGAQQRAELYRLESQRVEILPTEQPVSAIEQAVSTIGDKREGAEEKEKQIPKDDPKSEKSSAEEGSDIEIING